MSNKSFQMRMRVAYKDESNVIDKLEVEQLHQGGWEPFELNTRTPGFDIFSYSVFTCQQTYLRLNCAEQGLRMESAEGNLKIDTSEDWKLLGLDVEFSVKLRSGEASDAVTSYIVERMTQCPVSKNICDAGDSKTLVQFMQ